MAGDTDIEDMQETLPEDRNMVATIAAEEVFAIPNALFASELIDAASDVLSPVVEEIIGDSVVDVLTELGADSIVELLVGEALNGITGGVLGTLAGLTYSAYRCGAFWIAPTAKSGAALIFGMLGGLFASTILSVAWIGCTLFGAFGAGAGRWGAIKLSNKFMDKYFPSKSVKAKKE